jgi:hypothetical protein
MNDANVRWSWGWGWLVVVGMAGVFLYWAALSCYHDSIDSKGPGGGIVWVLMAGLYGLSYALLLPSYIWLISPRPLWGLWLVVPPLVGSFAMLYWHTNSGAVVREAAWDQVAAWPHHEAACGPSRLLGSICFTLLAVAAGIALRLLLPHRQASEGPAI